MKHTTTVLAVTAALLGLAVSAPKPVYAKTITKKVTRTIKIYKPGKYHKVKQTVTLKKKKGHKWTTAKWKTYKVPKVSGYKATPKTVKAAKVTHKTKNKTVKITYKAIKRAATKKTTYKTIKKAKRTTIKKVAKKDNNYQMRKDVLNIINRFRAKVGVKPVKMSYKYNAILDKRATEKAKLYSTKNTLNHDGFFNLPTYLNTYSVVNGRSIKHGGETLHAYGYRNNVEMRSFLNSTFTDNIQAEKVDYEDIFIKKTKKKITNPSGTIGHYKMMIDPGNHTVYIGFGHYGQGDKARGAIAVEFHS